MICTHVISISNILISGQHGGHSVDLDVRVSLLLSNTFANSTRQTYEHIGMSRSHFVICRVLPLLPITIRHLDGHIAYLSTFLCYSSIMQYHNAVRLVHLNLSFPNSLINSNCIDCLLNRARRALGDTVSQKLPITPHKFALDIEHFRSWVDFGHCFLGDMPGCLFHRKSNLLIEHGGGYNPSRHLCRSDFIFNSRGVFINVRWSNTIQYQERVLSVPIPFISNSPFCPCRAALVVFILVRPHTLPASAFLLPRGSLSITTSPLFFNNCRLCGWMVQPFPDIAFVGWGFICAGVWVITWRY